MDYIEELHAYHEAGHALGFITHRVPISGVVIGHNSAGEGTAGGVTPMPGALRTLFGEAGGLAVAAVTQFAGPAATDLRIAELDPALHANAQLHTWQARDHDVFRGWQCSEVAAGRPLPRVADLPPPDDAVDAGIGRAVDLLRPRWATVQAIAGQLLERKALTGDEVYAVAGEQPLPLE